MNIKPIKNEQDYESTLQRVDVLMDAVPNSEEFDELEVLTTLIEAYEAKHYKIDAPDPISAIKFRMEQENLKQKDLAAALGDETRVSKILSGKRELTVTMIRNLHEQFKIPFESLFGEGQLAH
ncbi:MAG: helix-turn-helix domain-containing protein [Sulfurimonas sp.]|jgi:HTH-type transcriptional regulator/antitoxin HigA|nr:helix-turn-helix domain-containing protein [Sulfurimonas sp.]MBU1217549.1 helix-turn-helix domain-containing protein [bacterium]MBU1433815.1 helix-turn-helix domain-containing protein [bacterium]MBU1503890.1 helix-turn-helix domain-containing protein [bacterium]MBU3939073.1 helix-turn-helix domain-containing protein [bacterium]